MPAKPNTTINNLNLEHVVRMLPKERRGQVRIDGETDSAADEAPIKRSSSRLPRSKSYEDALDKVKARSAEVAARKAVDYEARILQDSFPFWDDDNRGVPNPLIRGGLFGVGTSAKREFLPNMAVASLSNYEITYTPGKTHSQTRCGSRGINSSAIWAGACTASRIAERKSPSND